MSWTFIYLMFVLKIPIAALLWIVWWAIHAEPEADNGLGEGGIPPRRHPRHPSPRRPRSRGPHGDPVSPSPPRMRRTTLRARRVSRHA